MTLIDDVTVPLAMSLLAEFGKQILIQQPEEGAYNPVTGKTATVASPTQYLVMGVIEVVDALKNVGLRYSLETTTYISDFSITISALEIGVEPLPGWNVYLGPTTSAARYEIAAVLPIYSGNEVCLYILKVKQ